LSVSYGICGAAARRLCAIQSARGSDAPSKLEVGFWEVTAIDTDKRAYVQQTITVYRVGQKRASRKSGSAAAKLQI